MNNLELCQAFQQDIGLGGNLVTTENQLGMLGRLVAWIADAEYKVCSRWADWNFLWAETSVLLTSDSLYLPPALLGSYDRTSFWYRSGTSTARPLPVKPYLDYRATYKHQPASAGDPEFVVVLPNQQLVVWPPPGAGAIGSRISFDYWRQPVKLVGDNAVSPIPVQYHEIIIWRAKQFHAAYRHDNGAYAQAEMEFARLLKELEAHSLPDQRVNRQSSASEPLVIQVA